MAKGLIFILLILTALPVWGQAVMDLRPVLGTLVDKSREGEIEFIETKEKCQNIWAKLANQDGDTQLSEDEKRELEKCPEGEEYETYWDILGNGCSWYCGGGQDTLSASSSLKPFKELTYSAKNIHDLSYKTAWVEGVPGYGVGEFVTYHVRPQNPRITEIIVVNGYVKSDKAWRENSRVKKLRMYLDGKPYAVLNLEDTKREQHFKVDPLGYSDREDWDKLQMKPWWTMKFEILAVYRGEQYDDTAITEIYFDGIDVH